TPAYPFGRRTNRRLGVPAIGLSASEFGTGHIGIRPSGHQVPAQIAAEEIRRMRLRFVLGICLAMLFANSAEAFTAYVSNEKSNTVSKIDTDSWKVTKTIRVGQRPRGIAYTKDQKYVMVACGDDDTIQLIDTQTDAVAGSLPSGPDPAIFTAGPNRRPLYIAT